MTRHGIAHKVTSNTAARGNVGVALAMAAMRLHVAYDQNVTRVPRAKHAPKGDTLTTREPIRRPADAAPRNFDGWR